MALHGAIQKVLWTEDDIANRVKELAAEINEDLSSIFSTAADDITTVATGSTVPVVFIGIATGAVLFLADLVRHIKFPISIDLVRAESYGSGTRSNGSPTVSFNLKTDVRGKHIFLVEDIVDTGHTLSRLMLYMESEGASSVSVCAFLDKPARRKINVKLMGKGRLYMGFECPDYFVVGYGMDFAELYRNLPYVGVLKPECYK